jgi:hypothetical protein
MKGFAQNRTTIDFTAVFRSIEIVAICFDTASADCRPVTDTVDELALSDPMLSLTRGCFEALQLAIRLN